MPAGDDADGDHPAADDDRHDPDDDRHDPDDDAADDDDGSATGCPRSGGDLDDPAPGESRSRGPEQWRADSREPVVELWLEHHAVDDPGRPRARRPARLAVEPVVDAEDEPNSLLLPEGRHALGNRLRAGVEPAGVSVRRPGARAIATAASAVAVAGCGASRDARPEPEPAQAPIESATAVRTDMARESSTAIGARAWAWVRRPARVHRAPAASSRVLGRLGTRTREGTDELVGLIGSAPRGWMRVRTPLLPTGMTGWVRSTSLSHPRRATTSIVIDRSRRTLVLRRDGLTVLRARVAVGKASTPTPAGRFYVRTRLVDLPADGPYGPLALGTSARVDGVSGWPGGGGWVGIHGTDEPQLLGSAPSHGCVRVSNRVVRRLGRLVDVGSPVTIR